MEKIPGQQGHIRTAGFGILKTCRMKWRENGFFSLTSQDLLGYNCLWEELPWKFLNLTDAFSGGYCSYPCFITQKWREKSLRVTTKICRNALRTLVASNELLSMLAAHKLLTDSVLVKLRCYKTVKQPVAPSPLLAYSCTRTDSEWHNPTHTNCSCNPRLGANFNDIWNH